MMKLGILLHPRGAGIADRDLFGRIIDVAAAAEASGFDSLWAADHFYAQLTSDWSEPRLEPYAVLAGLVARTRQIKLGSLVSGVTFRNPAHLAKIVTTLDVISQGRAILGIGAARLGEEHHDYGYTFPPVAERIDRLSEAVQICRLMFDNGRATFSGRYYSIAGALNYPRPIQERIPILVGGDGERRTLRLVAQYGDACNISGSPTTIRRKLDVLERHAHDVGRDPAEITKTTLKMIVVGDSHADAVRGAEAARVYFEFSQEAFADFAVVGDADEVRDQAKALSNVGVDGIVCMVPNPFVTDQVVAAGEALRDFGA